MFLAVGTRLSGVLIPCAIIIIIMLAIRQCVVLFQRKD